MEEREIERILGYMTKEKALNKGGEKEREDNSKVERRGKVKKKIIIYM